MESLFLKTAADEALVLLAPKDDAAASELISRYLPSIRRLARIYSKSSADRDDLVSEGILGLMNAIKTFEHGKGAAFSTYAGSCVNNRMMTALKKSAKIRSREESLDGFSAEGGASPEKIVADREALKEIFSDIAENLSGLESAVFKEYLSGASYKEIAERLGTDRKTVDNALARGRRRLRKKFR